MLYNVFVYGTLRDQDLLYRLLRRNPPMKPARVNDYMKFNDEASGFPMAIHQNGSFIDGALLTGIGNRDMSTLDNYEGTHKGLYKRIKVQVLPSGSKTPVDAEMYVKGGGEL
jgi:gamma-glutamylcyclotransferase (GGCT)/AIG2-like uncharacterized protein YtfP